jgi:hypothetical protein
MYCHSSHFISPPAAQDPAPTIRLMRESFPMTEPQENGRAAVVFLGREVPVDELPERFEAEKRRALREGTPAARAALAAEMRQVAAEVISGGVESGEISRGDGRAALARLRPCRPEGLCKSPGRKARRMAARGY